MPCCSVPMCNSGYPRLETPPDVSFHRYPKDETQRALWIRKIHRDFFTANDSSRVCSLHFKESDYESARNDANKSRLGSKGPLKIKRLKAGVFPSIFPHHPSYHNDLTNNNLRCSAPTVNF